MAPHDLAVVQSFRRDLIRHGVPVHSVILFGSRARGDGEPDSDFDILVVVDSLDREIRRTVHHSAWEVGLGEGSMLVPVLASTEEVEHGPMRSSLLMQAVLADGVVV